MVFRSAYLFHIVLLWILIIGCYGSVQLNNDVEFYRNQRPTNLNHPVLQWNRKMKNPIKGLITVNDSLALVWTHRSGVMILNLNNGKKEGSAWTPPMGGHITDLTVSKDGKLFAYISMKNRMIGAYDIRKGKHIWKRSTNNLIKNKPLILSDSIMVVGLRSGIKLFNLNNGEIIKEKLNRFGVIKLFPTSLERFLMVTDSGFLQCYDYQLSKIWSQTLSLNFESNINVDQDRIFIGPGRDTLWVLDEETGNIQNSIQFINGFEFTVQDNDLFLLYRDGPLKRMSLNKRTFWASDFELGIPGESFFHTDENLIVPFAKGVVINVNMNTGTEIWRSDSLQRLTGFWQAGRGFLMQDIKYQMQYYR